MNLAALAKKAAELPADFSFEWPGPEHWHPAVFDRQVSSLPEAIEYINELRNRMADFGMALDELQSAYRKLRDVILEAKVGE